MMMVTCSVKLGLFIRAMADSNSLLPTDDHVITRTLSGVGLATLFCSVIGCLTAVHAHFYLSSPFKSGMSGQIHPSWSLPYFVNHNISTALLHTLIAPHHSSQKFRIAMLRSAGSVAARRSCGALGTPHRVLQTVQRFRASPLGHGRRTACTLGLSSKPLQAATHANVGATVCYDVVQVATAVVLGRA